MAIKVIELIGVSKRSFDDAISEALARAAKTVRGITGLKVLSLNAVIEENRIVEYRANVKIAFRIEG